MSPVSPTSVVAALEVSELLDVATARALREAGVRWRPRSGDRFVIADREMDAEIFVVSDMVADLHQFPSGPVIGFNGTVEWALDSVAAEDALWLPAEDQLRRMLGGTFVGLRPDADRWRVDYRLPGADAEESVSAPHAAEAYALALLALLARVHD